MTKFFLLTILFGSILLSSCGTLFNNDVFDAEKWGAGDPRARGRMGYSLRNDNVLVGKTAAEVISILGEPDWSNEHDLGYAIKTNVPWDIHFDARIADGGKVVTTDIGD